jgi:hypothetical protein
MICGDRQGVLFGLLATVSLGAVFTALQAVEYLDANFTISIGVKKLPGLPPIIPLIPDIDFINDILYFLK